MLCANCGHAKSRHAAGECFYPKCVCRRYVAPKGKRKMWWF